MLIAVSSPITDFVRTVAESHPEVETDVAICMTTNVHTANAQAGFHDDADVRIEHGVSTTCPVVDETKAVVDIITTTDLRANLYVMFVLTTGR